MSDSRAKRQRVCVTDAVMQAAQRARAVADATFSTYGTITRVTLFGRVQYTSRGYMRHSEILLLLLYLSLDEGCEMRSQLAAFITARLAGASSSTPPPPPPALEELFALPAFMHVKTADAFANWHTLTHAEAVSHMVSSLKQITHAISFVIAARSLSGDVVFVDEAHFIPLRTIQHGPLAMFGQDAVIIMASTPATGESGIQGILDAEHPTRAGEPLCRQVDLEFTCPECKRIQLTDPSHMCEDRMYLRPFQQNINSLIMARAAFGSDVEAFRREMMGTACIGHQDFIPAEYIQRVKDNALIPSSEPPPQYVYVCCDPNGSKRNIVGGGGSDYAVITAFFDTQHRLVVAGIDAWRFAGEDAGEQIRDALLAHYTELRQHRLFRRSTILYVFENNLGHEHNHLASLLQHTRRVNNYAVLKEREGIIGFRTFHNTRLAADMHLRDYMYVGHVHFLSDMICINSARDRSIDSVKAMLLAQVEQMKQYDTISIRGQPSRFVTSLFTEDRKRIKGRKDDLQRALSMLIYVAVRFRSHELPLDYKYIAELQSNRVEHETRSTYFPAKTRMLTHEYDRETKRRRTELPLGNDDRK